MLSRVAETIFWLARYTERTQAMLQVIRTNYVASQEEGHEFNWQPLLRTYGELTPEQLAALATNTSVALQYLVLDRLNGISAYANIQQSRENARAAQDHIAKEVWQCLNSYYHLMRDAEVGQQIRFEDPMSGLDALLRMGLLFTGTVHNTMPREESYFYLSLGKFLERAIQTIDIILMKRELFSGTPLPTETAELRYLLYSVAGYELYTKTHRGRLTPDNVLHQLLYHPGFAYSLRYCLDQLSRYAERLQPDSLPDSYAQVEFVLGRLQHGVRYSQHSAATPDALHEFLLDTRRELLEVGAAIGQSYFNNSYAL